MTRIMDYITTVSNSYQYVAICDIRVANLYSWTPLIQSPSGHKNLAK